MNIGIIKVCAVFLFFTAAVCCQSKKAEVFTPNEVKEVPDLTIRYIANEGVLIRSGDKQILIDGLHREYKPAYAFPPPNLQASLENARPPYDKIDLLLVSHVHLDHFHPLSIAHYLKNNPKSTLVSSEQVVGDVAKNYADYEKIKSQVRPVRHEWKRAAEINYDRIKIRFLGLRHANAQHAAVQNLGHLIEIGGRKLLHIGDAEMTPENFSAFNLSKENIDTAFIPYWFLLSAEGRSLVREQFNPKQIIAVHISPDESERISRQLKNELPDLITFTKILEEKSF